MGKNLKRKLIGSIFMLFVALSTFVTSTYAWFSMNSTVTVTGMSIKAESDTVLLQIKGKDDTTYGPSSNANVNLKVKPVSHEAITGFGKTFTTISDITPASNWWFGYSSSDNSSVLDTNTAKVLDSTADVTIDTYVTTSDTNVGYFIKLVYQVNISKASGLDSASNLKVSKLTINPQVDGNLTDGIRILIIGENDFVEFNENYDAEADGAVAATVITNKIPKDEEYTTVTVYAYIDGQDEAVKTANSTKLAGLVSFELSGDAKEYTE